MTGEKKPFWSGMSGTLAGITALITAIGGLIAVLIQVGVIGGSSSKASSQHATPPAATTTGAGDWAAQANVICARTNDAINALPDSNTLTPKAALALLHTNVVLSRQMLRELTALPKPAAQPAKVNDFLQRGARMNQALEELWTDFKVGNIVDAQKRAHSLSQLGQRFDNAANALGATTCAEGASLTGGLPGG